MVGTAQLRQNSRKNLDGNHSGRVVAHIVGAHAGELRLDIDLPEVESVRHALDSVRLVIPGEGSPLAPISVVGEDGHYIISFFSADIANAGHLPAEAVVCWETTGREHRMRSVDVSSATRVQRAEGAAAVSIPGSTPHGAYPRTVILLAAGALAMSLLGIFVVLLQK